MAISCGLIVPIAAVLVPVWPVLPVTTGADVVVVALPVLEDPMLLLELLEVAPAPVFVDGVSDFAGAIFFVQPHTSMANPNTVNSFFMSDSLLEIVNIANFAFGAGGLNKIKC